MAILKFKDPITGLWNAVKIYARSLGFSVDGVGADSDGNVPLGAVRFGVDQTSRSEADKAQARSNVGAASANDLAAKASGTQRTATLPASGWSGAGPYTYTANVEGVTADNLVLAGPAPASKSAYEDCGAYPSAQGAGTLTFTAESVPTEAVTVNVAVFEL